MSNLSEELTSVSEILENIGLVKGEKYAQMCKFLLNTGTVLQGFILVVDDDAAEMLPLMRRVLMQLVNQHAAALGIGPEDMGEAVQQAISIQQRLDGIKAGDLNA